MKEDGAFLRFFVQEPSCSAPHRQGAETFHAKAVKISCMIGVGSYTMGAESFISSVLEYSVLPQQTVARRYEVQRFQILIPFQMILTDMLT